MAAEGSEARKHEVSFCADVKSWADQLFAQHPEWPFGEVLIEGYGEGTNKRQDLVILDRARRTLLTGEVKMPGTLEGRNPFDPDLMRDAFEKADNIQSQYFFTWNVNTFVLFDRSQWKRPMIDRRVKDWELGLDLTDAGQCAFPEVQAEIRDKFLPKFFAEFADIVSGRKPDWPMPPDVVFIRSLEKHLGWPVSGTRDFLAESCIQDTSFATRLGAWITQELQWSIDPKDADHWRRVLDRVSRTLCYVFCNRAVFYNAVQARYPALLKLSVPSEKLDRDSKYAHFRKLFEEAVAATGDYEPVFYPEVNDWVGALIFGSPMACHGWKGLLGNLDQYNFRDIPHDIVGGIFQKLIAPEERQKFGQFFTQDDVVDVINGFCIRRAGDTVLDPACGSGTFLVRAYHRKAWLSEHAGRGRRHRDQPKTHQELLQEIFGCDIALFPAHLATLNLAARRIEDMQNYPLIRRGNFFEIIEKPEEFCTIPVTLPTGAKDRWAVPLPALDAIVGNPPYVRQEMIPRLSGIERGKGEKDQSFESRRKNSKDYFQRLVEKLWPGLELSGRSDLHCYFWPVAAKHLKEGGYFGFLTSSSWLDVEYGFPLQGWILSHFKLIAIMESVDEPWFEDARIKTCVTILQRSSEEKARNENLVKFVRLQKPLKEILGERAPGDESARQEAVLALRRLIESAREPYSDEKLRIIPVSQAQLWEEGVEAGRVLGDADAEWGNGEDEANNGKCLLREVGAPYGKSRYVAGKWGRFLRAPDIYFRIMRDYGHKFVKLGEIADIRRGITSGCDAFFMPRDVTKEILRDVKKSLRWNDVGLMTNCPVKEVESGKVRIVQAGDKTLHPIEAQYLRPEVHSLMAVDRPIIRTADVDRVVLWVNKPLREIGGTYAAAYIRWGAKQTFASERSKSVPLPQRSTCAARPRWFDVTGSTAGDTFWPMSQQYRHVIPANPQALHCNHNLFYVDSSALKNQEAEVLRALLNSTVIALFKTYYGRYAGTEGNLKTEVVDVKLLAVPEVRGVAKSLAAKIKSPFASMQKRETGRLVEEGFMACHTVEHVRELATRPVSLSQELQQRDRRQLDDAVLQMLGVRDAALRKEILDELYLETARHYRQIRVMEIQKQVQRAGGSARKISPEDIAATIWDSLDPKERGPKLLDWLAERKAALVRLTIPEGKAKALGNSHMFSAAGVDFAEGKRVEHETYSGPEQAALVASLADLEIRGQVEVPADERTCRQWRKDIKARLAAARTRFEELARTRSGKEGFVKEVVGLLAHWLVHGRPA